MQRFNIDCRECPGEPRNEVAAEFPETLPNAILYDFIDAEGPCRYNRYLNPDEVRQFGMEDELKSLGILDDEGGALIEPSRTVCSECGSDS